MFNLHNLIKVSLMVIKAVCDISHSCSLSTRVCLILAQVHLLLEPTKKRMNKSDYPIFGENYSPQYVMSL